MGSWTAQSEKPPVGELNGTLTIAGVCNYNPETVVFAIFRSETHGMGAGKAMT